MPQIQQINPLVNKEVISAAQLQKDLNQLFTTVNRLDKDNLYAPGGVFDFGGIFLDGVSEIQTDLGDPGDENKAVNKSYLEGQIDNVFPSGDGDWHKHSNKSVLDAITDAGSGSIITIGERSRLPSQDQKDALDNANSPNAANPIATMADVPGAVTPYQDSADLIGASTFSVPTGTKVVCGDFSIVTPTQSAVARCVIDMTTGLVRVMTDATQVGQVVDGSATMVAGSGTYVFPLGFSTTVGIVYFGFQMAAGGTSITWYGVSHGTSNATGMFTFHG